MDDKGKVFFDSNKKTKKRIIVSSLPMTHEERELIYNMINCHIIWGEGGCLIQDDGEVDMKQIKMAQSILKQL
jgi:hypothetical protein